MTQNEFSKPFFAKFLESQQPAKVTSTDKEQAQPWPIITLPIGDMDHTMKYPSDNDEDIYI